MAMAEMPQSNGPANLPHVCTAKYPSTEDCQALFVNGISQSLNKCNSQAKDISDHLHGTADALDGFSMVIMLRNGATRLGEVDQDALDIILHSLTRRRMIGVEGDDDEDLRLIIYCHSGGVKAVKRALEDSALEEKLDGDPNTKAIINIIRRRLAVVAFGGISVIPQTAAKCVLNYVAVQDHFSQAWLRIAEDDYCVRYVDGESIKSMNGSSSMSLRIRGILRRGIHRALYLKRSISRQRDHHKLLAYLRKEAIIREIRLMIECRQY